MKTISRTLMLGAFCAAASFAQLYTLSTTTITAAITKDVTRFAVGSTTGMTVESANAGTAGTGLFVIDQQGPGEYMIVDYIDSVNNIVEVRRGQSGTKAVAHLAAALVWYGQQNLIDANAPQGSCTLANTLVTPKLGVLTGDYWTCVNGRWTINSDGEFYVPPTQCTFVPTTLTQTSTYTTAGNMFVLKGISNAAAGTMTLTCNILVPTNVTSFRGAILTDITLAIASSATGSGVVPTSLGTSTLGSVTFPVAAASETASTGTPVAIGGTVTTTGGAAFLGAVTTDGQFYTLKTTYSTVVDLSPDRTVLVFTMPILQSAASVSTLFTPGLVVHYANKR